MTAQPRCTSLVEAATQASVGLPIGFAVSYAVSMLGLPPAVAAGLITGLMFALSVARGYLIRRRFEHFHANIDKLVKDTMVTGNEIN